MIEFVADRAASLMHTYCKGVHSLVLDKDPPMRRVFFATKDHELWSNSLRFPSYDILSVAVHAHRLDIVLTPIFGDVFNVRVVKSAIGWEHLADRLELDEYEYRSQIMTGTGRFELSGHEVFRVIEGSNERPLPILDRCEMSARDMHTICVPQGTIAAWIIEEGETDPGYKSVCYSNRDLAAFDFSGMYKPVTPEDAWRISRVFEERGIKLRWM